MLLIDEMLEIAAASGAALKGIARGKNRFGRADAVLPTGDDYATVHLCHDGEYELAVWVGDEIVAAGRTRDLVALVDTMIGLQAGTPVGKLEHLGATDSESGTEALWHVVIAHGDEGIRVVAAAVGADPVLRRLRPWVSHGTLHLIHPRDRVGSVRYGMAFHPFTEGTFRLNVYGESIGPAESLETAVPRAVAAVEAWI
ncbi:hypothetical protein KOI35_33020 [Actinoplanes bogorensis]|uniref:Uncharacterized protein n=1 Tax=Paractinoplanes bogorensis TaxID=1610840 RepID=A0ABS5YZ21_9ACTN|nr:DUF6193 family natural product biosynthesis protein [Actinoplanes bogorensis]MBU2668346.1 hypothetical protein [Actinoplanes bogorensis]